MMTMHLRIEVDREEDGRWIAEISELPGVLAYGVDRRSAEQSARALALRVIADKIEHGEMENETTFAFEAA